MLAALPLHLLGRRPLGPAGADVQGRVRGGDLQQGLAKDWGVRLAHGSLGLARSTWGLFSSALRGTV